MFLYLDKFLSRSFQILSQPIWFLMCNAYDVDCFINDEWFYTSSQFRAFLKPDDFEGWKYWKSGHAHVCMIYNIEDRLDIRRRIANFAGYPTFETADIRYTEFTYGYSLCDENIYFLMFFPTDILKYINYLSNL